MKKKKKKFDFRGSKTTVLTWDFQVRTISQKLKGGPAATVSRPILFFFLIYAQGPSVPGPQVRKNRFSGQKSENLFGALYTQKFWCPYAKKSFTVLTNLVPLCHFGRSGCTVLT